MQLFIGLCLGLLIALFAWDTGNLSKSGAVAAALTGGLIFGLGDLNWAVLLLAFFISSSMLSHIFKQRKAIFSEKFSKGSRRDWTQVLANGGLGTLLVIGYASNPHPAWWFAFIGAMATVNADTWATEIGVLSHTPPRLITTGRSVEVGTSGGVSGLGILVSIVSAALIGGIAAWLDSDLQSLEKCFILIGLTSFSGLIGSLCDSLLGATIQAIYICPVCNKETEHHPFHSCGASTQLQRGWHWLNNNWVNFFASLVGASISIGTWKIFLN